MARLDEVSADRARKLIRFLQEFARIRRPEPARIDSNQYQHVLPFCEIPVDLPCCRSRAHETATEEGKDPDIWLEVRGQKVPELQIPKLLEPWIDDGWKDREECPRLREWIEVERSPGDGADDTAPGQVERLDLKDHPEVESAWTEWCEKKWLPWSRKMRAHRVYLRLFQIHQDQKKLGEQYELVVGIGRLRWRVDDLRIDRYLLVADAELEFDAQRARFVLRVHPEGSRLRPELGMLPPEKRPYEAAERAREAFHEHGEDPWDREVVDAQLRALVHSLDPGAAYDGSLEMDGNGPADRPRATFAPAIILRKRTMRGYEECLQELDDRLTEGVDVPPALAAVLGVEAEQTDGGAPGGGDRALDDDRLWLPKEANEQQQKVAELAMRSPSVLVQGPPGTGKSHTIANLVCHALALGQRVLVTAQTPRALAVLSRLLPEETRSLAISLLGQGAEERRSLERSVQNILDRSEDWNPEKVRRKVEELSGKLQKGEKKLAQLQRQRQKLRAAETEEQSIGDGTYRGTCARIARRLREDKERYGWIPDRPAEPDHSPVTSESLERFLADLRAFSPEYIDELSKDLPDIREDPVSLMQDEDKLTRRIAELEGQTPGEVIEIVERLNSSDLATLDKKIEGLLQAIRSLVPWQWNWEGKVVEGLGTAGIRRWKVLAKRTGSLLGRFTADEAAEVDRLSVELDSVADCLREAAEDARVLVKHLENGGRLGFWIFRPKVVRDRAYLLHRIMIDGHSPENLEDFRAVEKALRVRSSLEEAMHLWRAHVPEWLESLADQRQELEHLRERLDKIVILDREAREVHRLVAGVGGETPDWKDVRQVQAWYNAVVLVGLRRSRDEVTKRLARMVQELRQWSSAAANRHPVARDLAEAIRLRNLDAWKESKDRLTRLRNDGRRLEDHRRHRGEIAKHLPRLVEKMEQSREQDEWDERVKKIDRAWQWALARGYLDRYLGGDPGDVEREIRQVQDDIRRYTAQIAGEKAWQQCMTRLTETHRQHMAEWEVAIRRLGKGTGKYAARYRRQARKNLKECRDAIPAWIMPVHRVWDAISIVPRMFDLVIVDEASQCGIETLPLMALGKRMVIVGDDRQISPEAVGINLERVEELRREIVGDFPHRMVFDPKTSLYDVARIFAGTRRVTLREHFRCMPEIIEFSNRNFYSGRLIPLRQYGRDRLRPLESVFVESGYREGRGSNVQNRPEAERIVSKIVELCQDPRYRNKTMGVIVLQGQKQARLIEDMLAEELAAEEIERRRLVCGDAYSFQGDERDVIFLSLVAAPNARIGAMTTEDRGRSFNVAASRARDQEWLFYSVELSQLSPDCYRHKLLEHFKSPPRLEVAGLSVKDLRGRIARVDRARERPPHPFDSWFEVDVALRIAARGYRVVPQYEVAGFRIDLVLIGATSRLAVECDGEYWHGEDRFAADMARQGILERCGWRFFRVRESAFVDDPEGALAPLWEMLEEHGIRPENGPVE